MSDTTLQARGPNTASVRRLPNGFDLAALLFISAVLVAVAHAARHTLAPLGAVPQTAAIQLDPSYLPGYALRTVMRMFAALACSLLFTLTYATWAAKSRRAGLVLVPILDILQSLPIFGFLTFTVTFFLGLFPGQVIGAELAVVFVIFTSQAWNMMMSMSGGWFFLVASEAVTVGNTTFQLPGIGSYIAAALAARSIHAVLYAIVAMLLVILAYDQLLFRPLVAWSGKFRFETTQVDQGEDPWMLALLRRTRLLRLGGDALGSVFFAATGLPLAPRIRQRRRRDRTASRVTDAVWIAVLVAAAAWALWRVVRFCVAGHLGLDDVGTAVLMGVYTMIRVIVLMTLATLVWVPLGVMIGLRPKLARVMGGAAQFLAAFPANLFYPIFVVFIVRYALNPNIWLTPLMLLGTQWYIAFNVIAGAAAFPGDLQEAAKNFRVGGWLWWRRVILPGIFPYFVTGAITASGGSWNASLLAELATWGNTTLRAQGLGAYIQEATVRGDTARVLLGMVVMAGFVLTFNRLVWRPMYAYSSKRLRL